MPVQSEVVVHWKYVKTLEARLSPFAWVSEQWSCRLIATMQAIDHRSSANLIPLVDRLLLQFVKNTYSAPMSECQIVGFNVVSK